MAYKYKQGKYKCANPEKYKGTYPIQYRSSWEEIAFKALDLNKNVIAWSSESVVVEYRDPTRDNTVHRYFVDLAFKIRIGTKIQEYYVEVKPESQTKQPVRGRKKEATFLKESIDYARNMAKWKAATNVAHRRGIKFLVWTEKTLRISK